MYFLAPPNIHFLDVRESYFDGYREKLDSFFKSAGGEDPKNYQDTRTKSVYRERFYSEEQMDKVDAEARKFLFYSNADFANVKRQLQAMKRVLVKVSIFFLK